MTTHYYYIENDQLKCLEKACLTGEKDRSTILTNAVLKPRFTSEFMVLKFFDRRVFQVLTICFSTIIKKDSFFFFWFTKRKRKEELGEAEDQKRDQGRYVCINKKKKRPV